MVQEGTEGEHLIQGLQGDVADPVGVRRSARRRAGPSTGSSSPDGKVYSKAATLTVLKAYKPTVTALSTYSTNTGKARAVTITGTHFHDVSRVYVDGTAVKFTKTGTTKPGITVPASWSEKKVWITVASATGKSSKAFTYFTPLSSADRADYLFDRRCRVYQIAWRPRPGCLQAVTIASNAIDYTSYIRAADESNVEHGRMKAEYEKFLATGDTAMADFYKGLMDNYAGWRGEAKEDAAIALGNIKALGGKV